MNISILTYRALHNNSRINTSTLQRRMNIMNHLEVRHPHSTIKTRKRTTRALGTTNSSRLIPSKTSLLHNSIRNFRHENTRAISLNAHSDVKRANRSHNNLNSINTLITRQNSTTRRRVISHIQIRVQIPNTRFISGSDCRNRKLSPIRQAINLTPTTKNSSHLMSMHFINRTAPSVEL